MSRSKFNVGDKAIHANINKTVVITDVLISAVSDSVFYQCQQENGNARITFYTPESNLKSLSKFEVGEQAIYTFNGDKLIVRIVDREVYAIGGQTYSVVFRDKTGIIWSAKNIWGTELDPLP